MAWHCGGQYYAAKDIEKAVQAANKKIKIGWWRCVEIEDRKTYINTSEVLRPARLPRDDLTTAYVNMLKDSGYPPILRKVGERWGIARFFHQKRVVTYWSSSF
jgi:hypothetical protein